MSLPTTMELAEYTLAQQHPITASWASAEERLKLLADEHQLDLDLSTDDQLAAARRERFAPDQPTELFFNVWQRVGPGLHVMLSMRYESGDPARPFVDVSAGTGALADEPNIAAVAALAVRHYGVLRPSYLRWWSSQPAFAVANTEQDKRFLAAPLPELAGQPVPNQLTIRRSDDLNNYDRAAAAYGDIDREHPDHPRQATIESADDLAELQRGGTLFDILLDGDWVGYVAIEPGHKLGLAGYKIAELILTSCARGKGYGSYLTTLVSRALIDHDSAPAAVLIGTIHQRNTGALRAAQQAGRHDIGGWVTRSLTR